MTEKKDIKLIFRNSLNRNFEVPDIKQHLISLGYSNDEIENAFAEIKAGEKGENPNAVTTGQGLKGCLLIIAGTLTLLILYRMSNSYFSKSYLTLKTALAISFIVFGIIKVTRPLKDKKT